MSIGGWSYDPNQDPEVVKNKMTEYVVVSIELTREVDRSEIGRELAAHPEVNTVLTFTGGKYALMAILIHHDFNHLGMFIREQIPKLPGYNGCYVELAKEMIVHQPPRSNRPAGLKSERF